MCTLRCVIRGIMVTAVKTLGQYLVLVVVHNYALDLSLNHSDRSSPEDGRK